ncbi:MAG TPA: class I SAM-dependent methyltransferase, partial [Phycisphaerales bacterium]|nr:class I SAM-dependent methyltransferase [Phycisphaerales bacterium]
LAPFVEKVVSIDRSQPMLEAAKRRLQGHKNVQFQRGEIESLPLGAGSVDAAVSFLVLHHVDDPALAVEEMARIVRTTKGGGLVLVVDMVRHDREHYRRTMGHKHLGFTESQIKDMFKAAGLTGVSFRELPGEPDARGPGLFVATGRKA